MLILDWTQPDAPLVNRIAVTIGDLRLESACNIPRSTLVCGKETANALLYGQFQQIWNQAVELLDKELRELRKSDLDRTIEAMAVKASKIEEDIVNE